MDPRDSERYRPTHDSVSNGYARPAGYSWGTLTTDVIVWGIALFGSSLLRYDYTFSAVSWRGVSIYWLVASVLTVCFGLATGAHFRKLRRGSYPEVTASTLSFVLVGLVLWVFDLVFGIPLQVARTVPLVALGFALLLMLATRFVVRRFNESSRQTRVPRRCLIVGTGSTAARAASWMKSHRSSSFEFAGFVASDLPNAPTTRSSHPVVGSARELHDLIIENSCSVVVLAVADAPKTFTKEVVETCRRSDVQIIVLPATARLLKSGTALVYYTTRETGTQVLLESGSPSSVARNTREVIEIENIDPAVADRSWIYNTGERAVDLVVTVVALPILALPMALVAFSVAVTSKGPVFYAQERLGYGGEPFLLLKFRTMRMDAEKAGPQWAQSDDPRVTPIGKFLRKTRLDELPQLLNVLSGDMSLIGPRPERPVFYDEFETYIPGFRQRLLVKPGITGLAQISGGYDLLPEEKIEFDIEYIKTRSAGTNMRILMNTVLIVFTGRGAR